MTDETLQQPVDQANEQDNQGTGIEPIATTGEKVNKETLPQVSNETITPGKDILGLQPDGNEQDANKGDNTTLATIDTGTDAELIKPTEDRLHLPFEDRSRGK